MIRSIVVAAACVACSVIVSPTRAQNYPDHSRRLDEEGLVTIAFTLDDRQRASGCRIVRTSGFPRLDNAACAALPTMVRSLTGAARQPSAEERTINVNWTLPHDERTALEEASGLPDPSRGVNVAEAGLLPSRRRVNVGLYLTVDRAGSVAACKVRWSSGITTLDALSCERAGRWRYRPDGIAAGRTVPATFFWAAPDADIITQNKE